MADDGLIAVVGPSGDHIEVETPVPIPNTVVKHFEPMIVPTSVKVGIAGFLKIKRPRIPDAGPFLR